LAGPAKTISALNIKAPTAMNCSKPATISHLIFVAEPCLSDLISSTLANDVKLRAVVSVESHLSVSMRCIVSVESRISCQGQLAQTAQPAENRRAMTATDSTIRGSFSAALFPTMYVPTASTRVMRPVAPVNAVPARFVNESW
jgi:hypothetical protein